MTDRKLDSRDEQTIIDGFYEEIDKIRPLPSAQKSLIDKAVELAKETHKGQLRKYSNRPFIHHPLKVAAMIAEVYQDEELVTAAILHDVIEDGKNVPMSKIYKEFGDTIGYLVDAVTDTTDHFYHEPKNKFSDKLEKILYGGFKDIRCIILKLYDRKHNLISLHGLKPHKQIRMSFETQAIYEPLRKILFDGTNPPIPECATRLKAYLKEHNITTAKQFQQSLYNQSFKDFDNETFDLVYNDITSIVRKIEDEEVFKQVIETKNIDDIIDVLGLEKHSDGFFCANFKYKKGGGFIESGSMRIGAFNK